MTIISTKEVNTRKAHQCFACLRTYPAGTKMRRQVNVIDDIYSVYSCQTCDTIMSEFRDLCEDPVEGWYPEGCVAELPTNCFDEDEREEARRGQDSPEVILEILKRSVIRREG